MGTVELPRTTMPALAFPLRVQPRAGTSAPRSTTRPLKRLEKPTSIKTMPVGTPLASRVKRTVSYEAQGME